MNCIVFYIPFFLFLYIILSYEKRVIAISLSVITCICMGIANFTTWGGILSPNVHTGDNWLMREINLASALLLCILILAGIVTANKRSQQKLDKKDELLAEQQETLSFINEHTSEGLFRITDDGICTSANPAFASLFGYTLKDIINRSPIPLFLDKYKFNDMLSLLKMGDFVVSKEVELVRKDGSLFTGIVSTTRSAGPQGEIYYDGIVREVNHIEDVKADAGTNDTEEQAHFLSIVNHELRTPVNTIVGISNHLLDKQLPADITGDVKVLNLSSQNLVRILDNILNYNNINKGSLVLKNKPFDLAAICKQVVKTFRLKAEKKKIDLQLNIDPAITSQVKGDASKLLLVLTNMVSNALKFTDNGNVHIAISKVSETTADITLRFKITDTGIGIDTIHKPHIFDAFYQVNNSITRKYDGMGLGLYVCREVLALMGTYISIDSIPGRGSAFHFQLTLEKSTTGSSSIAEPYNLKGIRVLLVEDNQLNIFVAKKFFHDKNVYLEIAENGAIAVEKVKNNTFDVILMDLHMPGMDGFEATREIRKINTSIPVIAFSADVSQATRDKALAVGMNDFVSKPFEPSRLFDKIRELL